MLDIGINRGLNLAGGEVKGEDQFIFKFSKGDKPKDLAALFASEEEIETNMIYMFAPKVADKKGVVKDFMLVGEDLRTTYFIFYVLFENYLTKEELLEHFGPETMYGGLKINESNQVDMMAKQSIVNGIFHYICKAAVEVINHFNLQKEKPLKIKFYRQSPDKAMPRFTYKPIYRNWCELDEVSEEESKVKWSDAEKAKGYDNAMPPTKDVTQPGPKNFTPTGNITEQPVDQIPNKNLPFK